MRLSGLDHIQLAMPAGQEDSARTFFVELLGLIEVEKPGPLRERGGCWFRGPGIALHLGVANPFIAANKAHPAFLAPDLKALAERLEAAGAPIKWDDSLPQIQRFFSTDPFGNRLEFIAASTAGLTDALPPAATPQ